MVSVVLCEILVTSIFKFNTMFMWGRMFILIRNEHTLVNVFILNNIVLFHVNFSSNIDEQVRKVVFVSYIYKYFTIYPKCFCLFICRINITSLLYLFLIEYTIHIARTCMLFL